MFTSLALPVILIHGMEECFNHLGIKLVSGAASDSLQRLVYSIQGVVQRFVHIQGMAHSLGNSLESLHTLATASGILHRPIALHSIAHGMIQHFAVDVSFN